MQVTTKRIQNTHIYTQWICIYINRQAKELVSKVNRTGASAKFYSLTKERINGSENPFSHQVENFQGGKIPACRL
jgi:hypothetical protein